MTFADLVKHLPGDRCLLCGNRSAHIGIFSPSDPQKYGAAPGKNRIIRYCLCDKCRGRKNTQEKVEMAIFAEITGAEVRYV